MNQTLCIATSTSFDLDAKVGAGIDDAFFAKSDDDEERTEVVVSDERKEAQKKVDASIIKAIGNGVEKKYMHSKFSLTNGQFPHAMVF